MTKRRWMLLILLIAGGSIAWLAIQQWTRQPEADARRQLNDLFGQARPEVQQPELSPPLDEPVIPDPFANEPLHDMFRFEMPGMGLLKKATQPMGELKETPSALEWHVPLQKAEDAQKIRTQVQSRHITIRGEFPLRAPGSDNVIGTSSLMQSQPLPKPVDAGKVTRKVVKTSEGKTELVIVMPKAKGDLSTPDPMSEPDLLIPPGGGSGDSDPLPPANDNLPPGDSFI
jgi:hypothetical protein